MQKISKISIYLVVAAFALILFGALSVFFNPHIANAKIVSPSVTCTAHVQTDGSLQISEQRQVSFDDDYRSLWWPVTGFGEDSKITDVAVRAAYLNENGTLDGDWINFREVPFQTLWRDALAGSKGLSKDTPTATGAGSKAGVQTSDDIAVPGYYAFAIDARESAIYTFFPSNDAFLVFDIDYTVTDAVRSFDDVAELYWDYAPERSNMQTLDMNVSIQLPVPEGSHAVPNENVFAWGHGPAGLVDIKEDGTISIFVPVIEPGQYGQAHVLFPQGWLSNLSIMQKLDHTGTRLDSARAEEASWSDTWSYWLVNQYLLDIIMLGICMVVIIVTTLLYLKFGRRAAVEEKTIHEKADFLLERLGESDTTIPHIMDINPAEAGRIHRWNQQSASDFISMLMGLTYSGIISCTAYDTQNALGAAKSIRFHLSQDAKANCSTQLGAATLKLLFDTCGEGYPSISTDELLAFAKDHPEEFSDGMGTWQKALDSDIKMIKAFDPASFKLQRGLYITTGILALIALAFAVFASNPLVAIAFLATAIIVGIAGNYAPRRTQYGERAERLVEVMINKACEGAPVNEGVAKVLLPYAFACGRTQELFDKIADPTEVEAIWFKPGIVRFKEAPPMVDRLSESLEHIALRPDKPLDE